MKVCEKCGDEIDTRDGDNRCQACDGNPAMAPKARAERKRNRKVMDDALSSLGLVKVKGALGGTYLE